MLDQNGAEADQLLRMQLHATEDRQQAGKRLWPTSMVYTVDRTDRLSRSLSKQWTGRPCDLITFQDQHGDFQASHLLYSRMFAQR